MSLSINNTTRKIVVVDQGDNRVVRVISPGPQGIPGEAATAGGPTGALQYNSGGSLAGSSNLVFDGSNLVLSGSLLISGSLIPAVAGGTTSSFSLGSPTAAWKSLYVANNTIYFTDPSQSVAPTPFSVQTGPDGTPTVSVGSYPVVVSGAPGDTVLSGSVALKVDKSIIPTGYLVQADGVTGEMSLITSSLFPVTTLVKGTTSATISTGTDLFLIKSSSVDLFTVQNDGVVKLAKLTSEPTPVEGGIYYSDSGFYFGL